MFAIALKWVGFYEMAMRVTPEIVLKACEELKLDQEDIGAWGKLDKYATTRFVRGPRKLTDEEAELIRDGFRKFYPKWFAENFPTTNTSRILDFPKLGFLQAGTWRSDDDCDNQDEPERIAMKEPSIKVPLDKIYVLEVIGNSMNKLAPDGAYVQCINMDDHPFEVEEGGNYVLESWRGDAVERTFKQARKNGKGWEFWPVSDDPKWQEPVKLGRQAGEVIKIKAMVLAVHIDLTKKVANR